MLWPAVRPSRLTADDDKYNDDKTMIAQVNRRVGEMGLNILTYLNLSCPAVSQICNLTDLPPTFTTLLPNSTPIVWFESCLTAIEMGKSI